MMFKIALLFFALSYGSTFCLPHKIENEDDLPSKYEDKLFKKDIHYNSHPFHPKPVDCGEVYENGFRISGIYNIYPKSRIISCESLNVYCDMETNGGGWMVIQRRGDFKSEIDYFNKTWLEYKTGFGNLRKDFWLGNDNIHALSNQKIYSVRFDLGADNETAYAIYDKFWIENEDLKYKLHISDYSGTAGDSMSYHQNMKFSTKDQKNDLSVIDCAQERKGGWWYSDCAHANLNGLYMNGSYKEDVKNSTIWKSWKGFKVSLFTVEIKIRPHDF